MQLIMWKVIKSAWKIPWLSHCVASMILSKTLAQNFTAGTFRPLFCLFLASLRHCYPGFLLRWGYQLIFGIHDLSFNWVKVQFSYQDTQQNCSHHIGKPQLRALLASWKTQQGEVCHGWIFTESLWVKFVRWWPRWTILQHHTKSIKYKCLFGDSMLVDSALQLLQLCSNGSKLCCSHCLAQNLSTVSELLNFFMCNWSLPQNMVHLLAEILLYIFWRRQEIDCPGTQVSSNNASCQGENHCIFQNLLVAKVPL